MNAVKLITGLALTSLITISQSSLAEQHSSAKPSSQNVTPNTAPQKTTKATTTTNQDPSVADFKQETRQKREFTDALTSDIQLPSDDPAHKPENGSSSSSTPIRKSDARK